jgi:hypothetical protein
MKLNSWPEWRTLLNIQSYLFHIIEWALNKIKKNALDPGFRRALEFGLFVSVCY